MAKRPETSSVAALVLGRTMQRSAARDSDPELLASGQELESRALAAIKQHLPVLPPVARQLRFPGF
jgi:hypothetical protein